MEALTQWLRFHHRRVESDRFGGKLSILEGWSLIHLPWETLGMLQYLREIWRKLAAVVVLAIVAVCLCSTPVQAAVPAIKPDPAYLQGVESMQQQADKNPDSTTSKAFKDVLQQLFTAPAVQIPFRFVREQTGVQTPQYAGNIYFSQGAIFIDYDQSTQEERFATINNKLYTWTTGNPKGEILERFPGDTLAFVMYLIDPSAIMRSIYSQYLDHPKDFTVKTTANEKVIAFKKPQSGFKDIHVQNNPFWLKSFTLDLSKDSVKETGYLAVDAPISLEALPEALFTLPKGVTFKASKDDLKSRMNYL
jgi:hypothetical protein